MSLYQVQKLNYQLNRDSSLQEQFRDDLSSVLSGYELSAEEERFGMTPRDHRADRASRPQ